MFEDIEANVKDWTDEKEVEAYLRKILNKEAFDHSGLIYGMGHAVYTLSVDYGKQSLITTEMSVGMIGIYCNQRQFCDHFNALAKNIFRRNIFWFGIIGVQSENTSLHCIQKYHGKL